jgi:hypothetical protein
VTLPSAFALTACFWDETLAPSRPTSALYEDELDPPASELACSTCFVDPAKFELVFTLVEAEPRGVFVFIELELDSSANAMVWLNRRATVKAKPVDLLGPSILILLYKMGTISVWHIRYDSMRHTKNLRYSKRLDYGPKVPIRFPAIFTIATTRLLDIRPNHGHVSG